MTKSRDIDESEPATAPTEPPIDTNAVADVHQRMLTTSSAPGRQIDAGPGQQIAREMARRWLAQADINTSARPGTSLTEQAEIKQLKAEIKRLREDNETLKAATVGLVDLDAQGKHVAVRPIHAEEGAAEARRTEAVLDPSAAGVVHGAAGQLDAVSH